MDIEDKPLSDVHELMKAKVNKEKIREAINYLYNLSKSKEQADKNLYSKKEIFKKYIAGSCVSKSLVSTRTSTFD